MRLIATTTALFLASGVAAAAMTIDFDTGNAGATSPGNIAGTEFSDLGVTVSTVNPNNNPLALFNSNCGPDFPGVPCSGNDGDLASGPTFGTAPQGNVLIINGGSSANPNDDPDGGSFIFGFNPLVSVNFVDILDLDEDVDPIFTFTFDDSSTAEITADMVALLGTETGDNSLRRYSFSEMRVSSLEVNLPDVSGAVAALNVTPIPVPAALPLVLTGLGLLRLAARRRA